MVYHGGVQLSRSLLMSIFFRRNLFLLGNASEAPTSVASPSGISLACPRRCKSDFMITPGAVLRASGGVMLGHWARGSDAQGACGVAQSSGLGCRGHSGLGPPRTSCPVFLPWCLDGFLWVSWPPLRDSCLLLVSRSLGLSEGLLSRALRFCWASVICTFPARLCY